jgi:uncharacterized protein
MQKLVFVCALACFAATAWAAKLPDPVTFSAAIERGDEVAAKRWLSTGLPPDFEGRNIGTGLMIGAWEGNVAMMEVFHNAGADVNYVNTHGEQALLHAAWKGKLDAVRWLVERGAQFDREGKAWSALHYAAFAGHRDVLAYLLEKGANPNALSTNGSTPLMMAAREAQFEIATSLLAAGARTDIVNEHGENAARWAIRNNNLKIAKLIDASALTQASEESIASAFDRATPVIRSRPVADSVDLLLADAQRLEGLGRRDEALVAYRQAMTALKNVDQKVVKPRATLTGVTIRAQRSNPKKQRTALTYKKQRSTAKAPTNRKKK